MQEFITTSQNKELIDYYKNFDLLTGKYIYDTQNTNTSIILKSILKCDINCLKSINVSSGLFYAVYDVYNSAVGTPLITTNNADGVEYSLDVSKLMKSLVTNGFGGIDISKDNENIALDVIESDSLVVNGDEYKAIIRLDPIEDNFGRQKYYVFEKIYDIGINYNNLYETISLTSNSGVKKPLDSISYTNGLQEEERLPFDGYSLEVLEMQPIFDVIRPLIYGIERIITGSHRDILLMQETKTLISGNFKGDVLKQDVLRSNGGGDVKYISKDNPYLPYGQSQIQTFLRLISSSTGIAYDDLGLDTGGSGLGENAEKLRRAKFTNKIQNYRDIIEKSVYKLFEKLGTEITIEWKNVNGDTEEDKINRTNNKIDLISNAVSNGIITQEEVPVASENINLRNYFGL